MVSLTCTFLESSIEMVVLRRRQVACIRMGLFTFLIGAGLVFVYHYVDNNDYQKQMEDAISILERDTSKYFSEMISYSSFFFQKMASLPSTTLRNIWKISIFSPSQKHNMLYTIEYQRFQNNSDHLLYDSYPMIISSFIVWFHVNDDVML